MISKSTKKSRQHKLYYLQEIPVVRMLSIDSKRDFWLVTVLYKSGSCKHFECRGKSVAIRKLRRLVLIHVSPVYLAMHWG